MPGSLRFPNNCLALLWLIALPFDLQGQLSYKVETTKTITVDVPGATAAYAMDSLCADAAAENGVVTISAKAHGTTHIVVVTPSGAQTLEVVVIDPPVKHSPGFVDPFDALHLGMENGYLASQYNSSGGQLLSQGDFSRRQDDTTIHAHVAVTGALGAVSNGPSGPALSSAYYQIAAPQRDITILDQFLDESPLTTTGSIVRGVHVRQDNWFLHAGYTSMATFDGLFLPTAAEVMIEGGYRYSLTEHSSLTGSLYDFSVPSSDRIGRSGMVGLLTYKYTPSDNLVFSAELGLSRGIAGSSRLDYKGDRDKIKGSIRRAPSTFASLGANNLRGLRSDFSWTRNLTGKLTSVVSFYSNKLALPGTQQSTETSGVQFRYLLSKQWSLLGGATGSIYQSTLPPAPVVRNLTAPLGVSFSSRHFGAQGQYQLSRITEQNPGHQFHAGVHAGAGPLSISAFAERQTQAPSLAFILNQAPELQQALALLGVQATTIQQVDQLLSDSSYLFAAGYIKGATINLSPVRYQLGGTLNWAGHGRWPQLSYNFIYNDDHGLLGSTLSVNHSLVYTQKIGPEDLFLSYSELETKMPGIRPLYLNMFSIGLRQQLKTVPSFIIPEHHELISGIVFRDDNSKGAYEEGMPLIEGAEVKLDDTRKFETGADGAYRFSRVPLGRHRLEVSYKSSKPTFYSTQSVVEVTENTTVNFGIGFSLSGLTGRISSDAGQGVTGVSIKIRNKDQHWTATSDDDGSFALRQLTEGDYDVEVDEDSVPPGYLTAELAPLHVKVGASIPGRAEFSVRALRSIAGRVLAFDRAAGKSVPVASKTVALKESAKTSTTDASGRYLFRDLPAGAYTVAVATESREITKSVKLPASPLAMTNVDLEIGEQAASPTAPQPPPPPTKPASPEPNPTPSTASPDPPANTAAEREKAGRQLLGAGHYKEALTELTEAIRLAPESATAYNARGFAWLKLREYARALEDLDKAIRLNPNYADAFRIRRAAQSALGQH